MHSFPGRRPVLTLLLLVWTLGFATACCGIRFPFAQTNDAKEGSRPSTTRKSGARDRGPSRKDLARFYGIYGDPKDEDGTGQRFFVYETCDGRLLFGGMWGDVAPWVFRSVSDTAFEAIPAGGIGNDRLEFQVGWNGKVHAVAHTLEWKKSPLVRLGDLPPHLRERECP
ncbi:MAG TPA: hypothetical protein VMM84_15065 [Pyrinomonadaceae bacterium]|nr:hypothetical protein [Pyrinomonadaceae bacterium]